MGRLSALLLALLLGGAGAVALVSCGGGSDAELLPGTTASEIESNLDQVKQLAAEEDCIGAEDAVANVAAEVEELQGVDKELKAALQEGTRKLSEVVGECEETAEEAEPTLEPDVEAEELEEKKPKKDKQKEAEEPAEQEEPTEAEEGAELPPQSNGKGEEKGEGGGPDEATEAEKAPPSGGVGPGVGLEG
jgi:S-DNA-T family DNA segregation ATPase FtsK/SpoIIIE